jgi:AmmeMemoRadiSam system protein B
MLAHVFGPSVRIVPVLCSALMPDGTLSDPSGIEAVQTFLSACRDVVAAPGRRTTVVAGADLAHVGKRFGDAFDVTPGILGRVDERDREDLAYVTRGDAEAFYRSVMKDGNARRVCGLGCIYSALKTIQGSFWRAELLHYDQAPDPAGGIVSFASVIFD